MTQTLQKNLLVLELSLQRYIQYFRKFQIKDSYFSFDFIFIVSLIGETDVKEEEERHPVQQISDELKADMVNECVEKLVSPKDIEMTEETAEKADQETKDEGVEGNFQKYIIFSVYFLLFSYPKKF